MVVAGSRQRGAAARGAGAGARVRSQRGPRPARGSGIRIRRSSHRRRVPVVSGESAGRARGGAAGAISCREIAATRRRSLYYDCAATS